MATETTTDWFDHDPIEVSEQSAVITGNGSNFAISKAATTDPPIDAHDEFVPLVLEPAKEEVHADFDTEGPAASMVTQRWFTTAYGGIPPFIPDSYDASLLLGSSVTHLHDYDPKPWLVERALELRTAKAAELGLPVDDVLLDWDFGDVDFPLFTYPIGTYDSRTLRVSHAYDSGHYDRAGDPGAAFPPTPDPLVFYAIPVSMPGGSDVDSGTFEDPGFGIWASAELQQRAAEDARIDLAGTDAANLATVLPGDTEEAAIDPTFWEDNTWIVTSSATSYPSRGLPVAVGYDWFFIPDADTSAISAAGEDAGFTTSTTEVWLDTVWTPPRYRFRYFGLTGSMPPRRFRGRPDHLAGGAQRWAPHPKSIQGGRRWGGAVI